MFGGVLEKRRLGLRSEAPVPSFDQDRTSRTHSRTSRTNSSCLLSAYYMAGVAWSLLQEQPQSLRE